MGDETKKEEEFTFVSEEKKAKALEDAKRLEEMKEPFPTKEAMLEEEHSFYKKAQELKGMMEEKSYLNSRVEGEEEEVKKGEKEMSEKEEGEE